MIERRDSEPYAPLFSVSNRSARLFRLRPHSTLRRLARTNPQGQFSVSWPQSFHNEHAFVTQIAFQLAEQGIQSLAINFQGFAAPRKSIRAFYP